MPRSDSRRIVIVGFAGMQSLDVVGPFDVFSGADQALGVATGSRGYSTSLVSASGGLVRCESGLGLATEPLPGFDVEIDTLLLAGGWGVFEARQDHALV